MLHKIQKLARGNILKRNIDNLGFILLWLSIKCSKVLSVYVKSLPVDHITAKARQGQGKEV